MESINSRIKQVRISSGLSQEAFAERLGVTRGVITNIEFEKTTPKDSFLSLLCREFKVREEWLRTGEGEMLQPYDPDVEIAAFLGEVMSEVDGSIRKRLIAALSRLTPEEWAFVEKFARDLAADPDKKGD